MKISDKKTGEIWTLINRNEGTSAVLWVSNGSRTRRIESIEELTSRFEDYEEPEEVWYIDYQGMVRSASKEENDWFKENEIGNCFETKEEAEKAVEKLKAWKRLKELGFRFIGNTCDYKPDKHFGSVFFETNGYALDVYEDSIELYDDLELLFGGEE